MKNKNSKQKILILGGGFGGIKAALELAGHEALKVTLISDQDDFRYYPTLYNIALGKSHLGASIPLVEIFEGKDVELIKATAKSIDRQKKTIKDTAGKTYEYDKLIVALGVVTNFFGIKGLDKYAYQIKTLQHAQALRDHLHKQLVDEQKPDVNYVIIGGGPTGVELAGALPSYIHKIMERHGLRDRKVHVELVEAAPRLVPRMPKAYSRAIQKRLRSLGVTLQLNQTVQAETADSLMVSGHPIQSHTVVWTAGVTNHPFLKANGFVLDNHGKATVNEYLQAEPDIFVIGDNASTMYSGMAQTALYDGTFLAQNLRREAEGKKLYSYKPKKPIYVMPAGPGWSAVLWGKTQIYGRLGWLVREVADFAGYHDYEPWWRASEHFLALEAPEENCKLCLTENF